MPIHYRFWTFTLACFLIAGCTRPLTITYDSKLGAPAVLWKKHLNISILPYKYEKKGGNPRKLGEITSPVFGIDSTELIIDKNIAALVTDAFKEQIMISGFKVNVAEDNTQLRDADLLIQGAVKAFRLDIGPKDDIEIEIETTITDVKTGNILWSGKSVEKNSRFAGIMGNNRESINKYVSSSLAKVVKETLTNMAAAIEKISPDAVEALMEETIIGNNGRLALNSIPPQAQIYIDDVYYGLTPITIDLSPGIYSISFKLTGFKNAVQKIAIRKGRTTEFAVILEKE